MAITYGVEYLAPETINPIFFPRAFTRSYLQKIDQSASTVAIQQELDAISDELTVIANTFDGIGLYVNSPAGTVVNGAASGIGTFIYSFTVAPNTLAMVNYSLVMSAPTSSSSNVLSLFCVTIYDDTILSNVNVFYNPKLYTQSGAWQTWYSNNSVL